MESEVSLTGGSWITRAMTDDGAVRVLIVEADEVADAVREAHALGPGAARLAAEATLSAMLLAAYVKGDETLTLQLALDEPSARFVGELDPAHRYRARMTPADLPSEPDPSAVSGLLLAVKRAGRREVYRGITAIDSTTITEALRAHLHESSQVHGALATEVQLTDGAVTFAAAVLVERLPAHPDQPSLTSAQFHERWGDLADASVPELLEEIRGRTMRGAALHVLDHRPVLWACSCTRDKMLDALAGVGPDELRAMADEDGGAVVNCHFCNREYAVDATDLRRMADRAATAG